jgi:hypothetical protein
MTACTGRQQPSVADGTGGEGQKGMTKEALP